jgi:hypothetical protein
MDEYITSDQDDIKSGSKYLRLMIRVLWPIFVVIGLIGVPWQIPTVILASISVIVSLISYVLLKFERQYSAVNLYVYMFIFAPFVATVNGSSSSLEINVRRVNYCYRFI